MLDLLDDIPCSWIHLQLNSHFILEYLKNQEFIIQIANDTHMAFLRASKIPVKPVTSRIPLNSGELIITFCNSTLNLCNTKLCSYLDSTLIIYFNLNHAIIKHWEDNYFEIESSKEVFSLYQGLIKQVTQQVRNAFHSINGSVNEVKVYLSVISPYLQKINQLSGTSFQVLKNDFPEWMHSKISD